METKNLTCINCPMGCSITVKMDGGRIVSITGNTCKRGEDYAGKELTNPTRIVTTTVKVTGGQSNTVSVKTGKDIPKEKIFDCVRELKNVQVQAPVRIGDVVASDIAGTGIDVVATGNVERTGIDIAAEGSAAEAGDV